jgi:dienelactone hydrolase
MMFCAGFAAIIESRLYDWRSRKEGDVTGFAKIHLITGWLPLSLFTATGVCLVIVLALALLGRRARSLLREIIIGCVCMAAGGLLIWLLSDVFMVFGVSVGWEVMLSVAVSCAIIGMAITALIDSHGVRKVFAIILIPLVVFSCALQIDMIYGEYTTLASIIGKPEYKDLNDGTLHTASMSVAEWKCLAARNDLPAMPKSGIVRSVDIPATSSGFAARKANVYLPPAALSKRSPALPVMIMMSGQPGSPDRFFSASRIADSLNAFAAAHHGLAPIVVSPDQNGSVLHNSLCSNTDVYGNAKTYLTVDVTRWISSHLPAAKAGEQWMIGGFSQGATCSTQLGPANPRLYGFIFSVGGELEPTSESRAHTIERFFHSDAAAYKKNVPLSIIAKHAPSTQTYFAAAGQWDTESQRNQATIGQAAKEAGMSVTTLVVSDAGHDWHSVQAALRPAIDLFCQRTGLGGEMKPLQQYPRLRVVQVP